MTDPPEMTAKWVKGDDPPSAWIVQGGLRPMLWDEYVEQWARPEVPGALRCAVEGLELLADELSDGYFLLNDGSVLTLTQRACGDLLASIANKAEGYMAYFGPRAAP